MLLKYHVLHSSTRLLTYFLYLSIPISLFVYINRSTVSAHILYSVNDGVDAVYTIYVHCTREEWAPFNHAIHMQVYELFFCFSYIIRHCTIRLRVYQRTRVPVHDIYVYNAIRTCVNENVFV